MRNLFVSLTALFAVLAAPSLAQADAASDQTQAIRLCWAEIAAQAGAGQSSIRLDQVRTRARSVRVDLDVWRNGQLTNVRCEVARGDDVRIASITPELRATAALQ
jgi:hypothetical protein